MMFGLVCDNKLEYKRKDVDWSHFIRQGRKIFDK